MLKLLKSDEAMTYLVEKLEHPPEAIWEAVILMARASELVGVDNLRFERGVFELQVGRPVPELAPIEPGPMPEDGVGGLTWAELDKRIDERMMKAGLLGKAPGPKELGVDLIREFEERAALSSADGHFSGLEKKLARLALGLEEAQKEMEVLKVADAAQLAGRRARLMSEHLQKAVSEGKLTDAEVEVMERAIELAQQEAGWVPSVPRDETQRQGLLDLFGDAPQRDLNEL
jgi:hypothetical protein